MITVTASEARPHCGGLLNRVVRGEEIIITRPEKLIARFVPEGGCNLAEIRSAVNRLRGLQLERLSSTKREKP